MQKAGGWCWGLHFGSGWHLHGVQFICVDCDPWGGVSYSPLSYLDGWPLMEGKFPLGFLNAAFKAFSKTGPTLPS